MELHVFTTVLLAALLHATWNAFVKVDRDRLIFMSVLIMGSGIGALCMIPFVPLPATAALTAEGRLFVDGGDPLREIVLDPPRT